MLPHEIAERATTFDVMVTDALASYENYVANKQNNRVDPNQYTIDEMKRMMEAVREQK